MTKEEAIMILESGGWWDLLDPSGSDADLDPLDEAIDIALSALRSQLEPNAPLTLDVLREMDGEPVWIVSLRLGDGNWAIADCHASDGGLTAICESRYCPFWFTMDYGRTWLAYRRKPEGGKNDA